MRIGGAADSADAEYGGVVVFRRNRHDCLNDKPPQSSLSRSTFPSYPQAAGRGAYRGEKSRGRRGLIKEKNQEAGGVRIK
jgi:hypothetical protein